MRRTQSGFTLVEIAIVLVIIGLLLGGILKGQELINSARVRNLADTAAGVQAAYYGFIDRYRQVPGDMQLARAQANIDPTSISVGGDGNGQVGGTGVAADDYGEASALWQHLTVAGFLQGNYDGGATNEATYEVVEVAPINAFNGFMVLARTRDYAPSTAPHTPAAASPYRLTFGLGDNIPVDIALELDTKVDDGLPATGSLRFTGDTTVDFDGVTSASSASGDCLIDVNTNQYDIAADAQNCALMLIY